jgi:hypothetical protein
MKKIIQKMDIFASPIMFIDLNINNNTLKKFILNLEKKQKSRFLCRYRKSPFYLV